MGWASSSWPEAGENCDCRLGSGSISWFTEAKRTACGCPAAGLESELAESWTAEVCAGGSCFAG